MKERHQFHQEAVQLIKNFWHTYLVTKNKDELSEIFSKVTDNLVVIGTGKHEFYENADNVLSAIKQEQKSIENIKFEIVDEWYTVQDISDDVCLVYGTLWSREKADAKLRVVADMDTRFTIVCKLAGDEIIISSVHHSVPNADQQMGEFYPASITQKANEALQRTRLLEMRLRTDSLTGLYNRSHMENYVTECLDTSEKNKGAFFMIDLNEFKKVNDTYGHLSGDLFLRNFAQILTNVFGEENCASRLGGDEFAAYIQNFSNMDEIQNKANELLQAVKMHRTEEGKKPLGCTIGISIAPKDGKTFQELYRKADQAMYEAKREGKAGYKIFDKCMD